MLKLYLQFFGGRGSGGGKGKGGGGAKKKVVSASGKPKTEPRDLEKDKKKKKLPKTAFEAVGEKVTKKDMLDAPIGAGFMSQSGTLYVKQSKHPTMPSFTPYTGKGTSLYTQDITHYEKTINSESGMRRVPSSWVRPGAGAYMPSETGFSKMKTIRSEWKASTSKTPKKKSSKKK